MDALNIERTAVLGFSAGGPPAIQFALRHPERTLSLVLASAHLPTSPYTQLPAWLYRAVFTERLFWLLKTLAPGRLARIMGVPKGFRATAEEWRSIRYLMDGLFPIRPRSNGAVLDAVLTNPDVERYPLEEIAVPTLIIHSADDTLAHYETAPRAAARIPGARFITIDRGGHLFAGREAVVREEIGGFVRSCAAREPVYAGAVATRGDRRNGLGELEKVGRKAWPGTGPRDEPAIRLLLPDGR
jgi:pimeloyl-ACP methyl ester carboxylesterase